MAWNINQPSTFQSLNLEGKNHVKILIPHWGNCSFEWFLTTCGPLMFLAQPDYAKSYMPSRGILNLDTLRNFLVRAGLEDKTATHFLFLDSDCIMESPEDVNQALRILLSLNVPIVSGLYRAKKSSGFYPYCMFKRSVDQNGKQGYIPIENWTGNWLSVDVVGMGFCLIKRGVFETIPSPWFKWNTEVSEDFSFCELAHSYNFEVKVFTDVKLSHSGNNFKVLCENGKVMMLDV